MRKPRRTPNLTEKAAACLLMLKRGTGEWLIPEPIRSTGTADEIVRWVEWHHENYYAEGGTTDPRMLTPLAPEDHHERTNKIDKPRIAKNKRIKKETEEFRARLLAKAGFGEPVEKKRSKWANRKGGLSRKKRPSEATQS